MDSFAFHTFQEKNPSNLKLKKVFYILSDFFASYLTFIMSYRCFFVFYSFKLEPFGIHRFLIVFLRTKIHKWLLNTELKFVPSYSFWMYQYQITMLRRYSNSDLLKELPVSLESQVTILWGGLRIFLDSLGISDLTLGLSDQFSSFKTEFWL